MNNFESATAVMREQLGNDVVISLATCTEDGVNVRNVDGYYKDGFVYIITHTGTHKMKEIARNPNVAICKDLMCAQGIGENMGNPKEEPNKDLREELKRVFYQFYDRHVNEDDPGTCILRITLINAVAFSSDTKYVIDYKNAAATAAPFVNDIIS
ncbi:MAG TPA: pyridoxamine 5'-phosphate oxidase family protein [Ruminiclostridium sp.]|nr:pyridoxamine 5'-phosphate oxidase family protein [Ruminiclostridium sp.]